MIYTFYSYRGEIGRPMALANVAECFYLQGLRVVIVDADLERPGLEGLFLEPPHAGSVDGSETNVSPAQASPRVQSWPGLFDMLVEDRRSLDNTPPAAPAETPLETISDLRDTPVPSSAEIPEASSGEVPAGRTPSLAHYLVPIHSSDLENPFSDGGSLSLLPAGRRFREHSPIDGPMLRAFDRDELYAALREKASFDHLREQLLREADVVLIDGPSGVGDSGRAWTHAMADVVVCFCPPGAESLEGTLGLLEQLRSGGDAGAAPDRRPFEIVIIPVRADSAEAEQESEFDERFAQLSERSPVPAPLQARGVQLRDLQIPYPTKAVFREQDAIGRDGGASDATDQPEAADFALASHLAWLAPEGHALRRQVAIEAPAVETASQPQEVAETAAINVAADVPPTMEPIDTPPSESVPSGPTMMELFAEIRRELDATPEPKASPAPVADVSATAPSATPLPSFALSTDVTTASPSTAEAAGPHELKETADEGVGEPKPLWTLEEPKPSFAAEEPKPSAIAEEPKPTLTSRPVVFEPAALAEIASKGAGSRRTPTWGWPAAAASVLVLGAALYVGMRGRGDDRSVAHPTQEATEPIAADKPTLPPAATDIVPSPAVPEQAPAEAVGAARPAGSAEPPADPEVSTNRYLRIGLGPSCPRIIAYRRQFMAAGIPDAGAVRLKSGLCALVLGPYTPDAVERHRVEHNARHIRGFDDATIVDDHDFAKWL